VSDFKSAKETILAHVTKWLDTQAPRVRDQGVTASIKFTLCAPGGDDSDNTLVVDLHVEERVHDSYDDDRGVRVEGVAFETDVELGEPIP
jgi:hypothetical protein